MKRTSASALSLDLIFSQDIQYTMTKTFRLFSSFHIDGGLMQGVVVARDGLAFQLVGPANLFPKKRMEIDVPIDGNILDFDKLGFTTAEPLEVAPSKVIEEMYT